MKRPVLKRIGAYLIDVFLVLIVSSMFSNIPVLNPYLDEYTELSDEYINIFNSTVPTETENISDVVNITTLLENETLMEDMTYKTAYYGVYVNIIAIVLSVLYFVVFQYFNDGKTIGKAIFGIKVVTDDMKKPKMTSFLIRSLIVNRIAVDIAGVILIRLASEAAFKEYSYILDVIGFGLILASFLLMVFREDAKGLHDLLAKTAVINSNWKEDEQEEFNKIKEAKVVEKKKEKKVKKK